MADRTAASSAVAVIPARGGSKRIPRKNIRPLSGRALISWTIDTCLASGLFADVVVSTDDDEIAAIASGAGASVPFRRPADLADDVTPTVDVVAHALSAIGAPGAGTACCVYPAAALIEPGDLIAAYGVLWSTGADYVASVQRYAHPVQRALALQDDGRLDVLDPSAMSARTQDLPGRWHDAGQFYWGTVAAWLARTPILANAAGFPLPAARAVDIDTEEDWQLAQALHALRLDRDAAPHGLG